MVKVLLSALLAIYLALALGACNSVPESSPTPASGSLSLRPSPIRLWQSDDGKTRTVFLTIYDDDSAKLYVARPPESGVGDYGLGYASLERMGGRTFLIIFRRGVLEVAEIVERPGDHLAIWFHHDIDLEAPLIPQLGKLPTDVPPSATELTRFTL